MHVYVAGATGAIGKPLIPQLIRAGHTVTASTRSPAKADRLRALGAEPVVVDGLDARAVTEAVKAAEPDAIVHEMSALAGTPDFRHFDRWFATTNELRTKGTDNLLAAAEHTGTVRRFVAQSYTGWTNDDLGGPATEDEPIGANPAATQRETMGAIK